MPQMPYVPILIALKAGLEARFAGQVFNAKPVLVRHFRHRDAKNDERNCLSVRFVSSDPSGDQRQTDNHGDPEEVFELACNLVVDVNLPPEADAVAPADLDPTGLGIPGEIMAWALDWLIPGQYAPENDLGGLVWEIRYDGTANDDADASPDFVRLEERLTIKYRVRADQPTLLLIGD